MSALENQSSRRRPRVRLAVDTTGRAIMPAKRSGVMVWSNGIHRLACFAVDRGRAGDEIKVAGGERPLSRRPANRCRHDTGRFVSLTVGKGPLSSSPHLFARLWNTSAPEERISDRVGRWGPLSSARPLVGNTQAYRSSPKPETRMTNRSQMTNPECRLAELPFVILVSSWIRNSGFVNRV
jgi:hypothetical protein